MADAILYVAENPTRDYIVGDAGIILDIIQKVSPWLVDQALALTYNFAQHTDQPKAESDPNNLFEPVSETEGYDRVEGDYSNLTIPSLSDWINQNSPVKWGLIGLGLLGVSALVTLGQLKNSAKI